MVRGRDTSVENAVAALLADLKLDDMGEARAAIAMALAKSLDESAVATTGAMAQSVPGVARNCVLL